MGDASIGSSARDGPAARQRLADSSRPLPRSPNTSRWCSIGFLPGRRPGPPLATPCRWDRALAAVGPVRTRGTVTRALAAQILPLEYAGVRHEVIVQPYRPAGPASLFESGSARGGRWPEPLEQAAGALHLSSRSADPVRGLEPTSHARRACEAGAHRRRHPGRCRSRLPNQRLEDDGRASRGPSASASRADRRSRLRRPGRLPPALGGRPSRDGAGPGTTERSKATRNDRGSMAANPRGSNRSARGSGGAFRSRARRLGQRAASPSRGGSRRVLASLSQTPAGHPPKSSRRRSCPSNASNDVRQRALSSNAPNSGWRDGAKDEIVRCRVISEGTRRWMTDS